MTTGSDCSFLSVHIVSSLCNPHSLPVWGCSWHWSGDFLASGGMDHCCKVWDAQRYLWACWWGGGSYGYGLWFSNLAIYGLHKYMCVPHGNVWWDYKLQCSMTQGIQV